jgi:hypothetical protein
MIRRSDNGWPAHKDPAVIGVVIRTVVPGVRPVRVRVANTVAPLFVAALKEWHKRIEKLEPGECQGYTYREIRGGTDGTLSNHASGTAVDVWPARHPQNDADGNLTKEQQRIVLEIAKKYGMRSGGVYRKKDWMHLECVLTPNEAKALIKKLGLK